MPKEFNPIGKKWVDSGLGGFLQNVPRYSKLAQANLGKHRLPTLRKLDKRPEKGFVKALGHNGYFKSIKDVVHFYKTRDVLPRLDNNTFTSAPLPNLGIRPIPKQTYEFVDCQWAAVIVALSKIAF